MARPSWSFGLSLAIHAGVMAAALVSLPNAQQYEVEERDAIPIELIPEVTEQSTRQAVKVDAPPPEPEQVVAPPKIEPKPEAPPVPAAVEPEPVPEPATEAEPAPPAPDQDALKELTEQAQEAPKPKPPTPRPRPKPKPKPAEKPKELNTDELAALLNKIPDSAPKQEPSEVDGTPAQGPVDSLTGSDAANSADLVDYLRAKMTTCWNPPTGVMEAQDLVVEVEIQFAEDGTVLGTPIVKNSSPNPLFGVASAAVVRAVLRCQPYDQLPRARYEEWRKATVVADPSKMFAQ
jgi:outer membrane biosynthesis protein TonB